MVWHGLAQVIVDMTVKQVLERARLPELWVLVPRQQDRESCYGSGPSFDKKNRMNWEKSGKFFAKGVAVKHVLGSEANRGTLSRNNYLFSSWYVRISVVAVEQNQLAQLQVSVLTGKE